MGLAFIDYTLKRYVEDKDEEKAQQLGQRKPVAEALLTATKYADKIVNRIVDIPDKPGDLGLVFTTLTLMRSKSTLRACRILLKLGHGAESFVIARVLSPVRYLSRSPGFMLHIKLRHPKNWSP